MQGKTIAQAVAAAAVLIAASGLIFLSGPGRNPGGRNAQPTPDISLRDIDGVVHGSLEKGETDFTVLFFLGKTCPISTRYAPEIDRICDDYKANGASCYLVYPEAAITGAELKEHLRAFGHKSPAILDTAHALVDKAGATVTPEAAVFSRTGDLLYRGRIDDLYQSLGQPRHEARQHDLRDALDLVVAGKPAPGLHPDTNAVGCFIEPIGDGQQRKPS